MVEITAPNGVKLLVPPPIVGEEAREHALWELCEALIVATAWGTPDFDKFDVSLRESVSAMMTRGCFSTYIEECKRRCLAAGLDDLPNFNSLLQCRMVPTWATAPELARLAGLTDDAAESRLRRLRGKDWFCDCYREEEDRQKTDAKYLYRTKDVLRMLQD
jgi:hypothetical protein